MQARCYNAGKWVRATWRGITNLSMLFIFFHGSSCNKCFFQGLWGALASTSGTSATKHAAETCIGQSLQEPGRSLDTQAVEGADYGASHCIQQVTLEGVKAPAQARGKTSRSLRRKQRNRAAEEAARDAAGAVPWASLMGEEWEDGQQQEPTGECDDWGLYYQATDGDDYHHFYNLR